MYDPKIGQFLSEDPIGFDAEDANIRRYVFNAVTNLRDPDGLEAKGTEQNGFDGIGEWTFSDLNALKKHFKIMFPDFSDFDVDFSIYRTVYRGCIGLAWLRLGWNKTTLIRDGKQVPDPSFPVTPAGIPGAVWFTDLADAKAFQQKQDDPGAWNIIAHQLKGGYEIMPDRKLDKDRIAKGQVFKSEIKWKEGADLSAFNVSTLIVSKRAGEYWEWMNHTFPCPRPPANQDFTDDPVKLVHATELPESYGKPLYVVVKKNPKPDVKLPALAK